MLSWTYRLYALFCTVLLLVKSHGWKSLVGYSSWGHKESDPTEWLHFLSFPFRNCNSTYSCVLLTTFLLSPNFYPPVICLPTHSLTVFLVPQVVPYDFQIWCLFSFKTIWTTATIVAIIKYYCFWFWLFLQIMLYYYLYLLQLCLYVHWSLESIFFKDNQW